MYLYSFKVPLLLEWVQPLCAAQSLVDYISESFGSRAERLAGGTRVNKPCVLSLCPEVSAAFSRAVCQSCHSLVADTRTPRDWIMLTQGDKTQFFT